MKPEGTPTDEDSMRGLRLEGRRLTEAGMGIPADSPLLGSLTVAAATAAAAALVAAAVVTLLRRVTRWLGLTAPRDMEWEWWCRWEDWGRGRERDSSWQCRNRVRIGEIIMRYWIFENIWRYLERSHGDSGSPARSWLDYRLSGGYIKRKRALEREERIAVLERKIAVNRGRERRKCGGVESRKKCPVEKSVGSSAGDKKEDLRGEPLRD